VFGFAALGSLGGAGCGEPAPVRSAAPAAHFDRRIQIPEDAFAVIDVDLGRVRKSAVWHLIRRVITHESSLAAACPGVLASAQQATVALRAGGRHAGTGVVAVLHGIDRAATLTCLRAQPAPRLAGASPVASSSRPLACQRYDDAIHGLATCGTLTRTSMPELRHAQDALAAATGDGVDAACAAATVAVEHATARRSQLGWACGSDDFGHDEDREERAERAEREERKGAPRTGELHQLGPDSFVLEDRELLQFVDDHTLVTVRVRDREYGDTTELQATMRALLAPAGKPRWYDAARTARDRTRAIWLALDPESLDPSRDDRHEDDGGPPIIPLPRLVGTVDVDSDLSLELRLQRGHYEEELSSDLFSLVSRVDSDPQLAHATAEVTCLGPAPEGPAVERCKAAIAHRDGLGRSILLSSSVKRIPAGRLLDGEVYEASELGSCVDQPWPDAYLSCLTAAKDHAATEQCGQLLGDKLERGYAYRAMCGGRDVGLRIAVPLPLVEAFKLAELVATMPRLDCRVPSPHAPISVTVERPEPTRPLEATACFDGECLAADVAASHAGHADTRWRQVTPTYGVEHCLGPWNATPETDNSGRPTAPAGTLADLSLISIRCGSFVSASTESRKQAVRLCVGEQTQDCAAFRAAGPIHTMSVNPGGNLVALVSGAPGAQWVETFARTTKRRVARFSAGTTAAQPCARAQLLGDTVLVTTGACADGALRGPRTANERPAPDADRAPPGADRALPGPGAYLATAAGKRLALVGGDQPLALASAPPVALGGQRWAFIAATGGTVVIQDASTGVVERRVATGAEVEPGMVAAGADAEGHLVLAFGGATPRSGSLASIDTAAGTVLPIAALPVCPAEARLWPDTP